MSRDVSSAFAEAYAAFDKAYDEQDNCGNVHDLALRPHYETMKKALGPAHPAYQGFCDAVAQAEKLRLPMPIFAAVQDLKLL